VAGAKSTGKKTRGLLTGLIRPRPRKREEFKGDGETEKESRRRQRYTRKNSGPWVKGSRDGGRLSTHGEGGGELPPARRRKG